MTRRERYTMALVLLHPCGMHCTAHDTAPVVRATPEGFE